MQADLGSVELLRGVARSASGEEMRRLAEGVGDWGSLLRLAQGNRVLPMLYLRLEEMGPVVPAAAQEWLRGEYERNVFHGLANAVELIAVLKALDEAGIPAMPFKGVVLGMSLYQNLTTRSAGDLDVLIHYGDRNRAAVVLRGRGYELGTPIGAGGMPEDANEHEYHFERSGDGMVVELCWRMQLNRYMHFLGLGWVWPRRRVTMLCGVAVPDMDMETTLLMLCVHGSKHVWSRLAWTCDVARLLASAPELDWNEVLVEAKRSGLRRCLAVGVLLAHRVAGAEVPEALLRGFEADATACRMADYFEENMLAMPGTTPKGWLPYGIQMLDRRDRVRLLGAPWLLRQRMRDRAVPAP